ncbi:uncharacterized protein I206_100639 [Kwoniella pini CBS 10737]|uniref:Alpha-glucosidase n=1 Tax=Kwoniella pini CBS 10737 TaxID=1296096 RepID=A0A1B9ID93_9TREE|nr:alpha-glucosidase [Kwoniella pini CBS 10737]OCF53384.1 alpha-glucosidase [Kwoniella pini CBS 10737]
MLQRNPDSDWWRQAIIYQIYPRSFCDSNGDGIGDLKGITSKVPYLASLGIDAVWLSPFYPSGLKDGGYDVSDYRDVDPRIGTLEDFDEMSKAFEEVNIKVMVDIVPNHSSDEHVWFQEALKAGKGSKERERYIFRDGLGPNKDIPPTDWQCAFGGSSWTTSGCNDGQWYYHMFDSSQPDWNWDNMEIQEDFIKTLRFWANRGVSGFRIDVAHALVKDFNGNLPNWKEMNEIREKKLKNGNKHITHPYMDRDEVQEIYKDWRKVFEEYNPPLFAVAECWVAPDRKPMYASQEGLGQAFSFDMMLCNFDAKEYRDCIEHSLKDSKQAGSSTTWVLSNHDEIRHVTRYGLPNVPNAGYPEFDDAFNAYKRSKFTDPPVDVATGLRRAKAATLMILGLPGSTYIYQGEELGLPEVIEIPDDQRQDPHFHRTKGECLGRDGCRVPLPWNSTCKNLGFSNDKPPHLPQPEWMEEYSVNLQDNSSESTLNFYRKALEIRKELQCEEELEWIENDNLEVLHFSRPGKWEIFMNASKKAISIPKGRKVLISSNEIIEGILEGETTAWLLAE